MPAATGAVCVTVCLDAHVAAGLAQRAAINHHSLQAEMRHAITIHVATARGFRPRTLVGGGEWPEDSADGDTW